MDKKSFSSTAYRSRNKNTIFCLIASTVVSAGLARAADQPPVARRLVISLEEKKIALLENGEVVKIWPVAVGKESTPSPTGTFTIVSHLMHPTWYHAGKIVGPGKSNPLGTRWMGLSAAGYGIHGTNRPQSIGHRASHGCIRMKNQDAEDLFTRVAVGDTVELRPETGGEIAQIFGIPAEPTAPMTATAGVD